MTSNNLVSKNVAIILKEKNFTEKTYWYYTIYGDEVSNYGYDFNHNEFDSEYSAPSLQHVHRWIKNKHHIFIAVVPCEIRIGFQMLSYNIYNITKTSFEPIYQYCPYKEGKIEFEDVMNDAVKYVVENIL